MKSLLKAEWWLSLSLLIVMNSYSAAQAPQPRPDQRETELPALLRAKPLQEDPKDDALRGLLKARYNEVVAELGSLYDRYMAGRADIVSMFEPGQRLVQTGVELLDKPAEKVALLTQYVEMCRYFEKLAKERLDGGVVGPNPVCELHRARYHRLDAEIQLLRAKREADEGKGK